MKVWARLRRLLLEQPEALLLVFCLCLLLLNVGRLDEWGVEGFRVYLTTAMMQTTLFDFAWILVVLALFIDEDAQKLGLRWVFILVTFPFMPTIGVLLYFVLRKRALKQAAATPQ